MGKVNYSTEQIIVKLREVEVLCGQGKTIGEAVRQIGVTEQTYYRWRKKAVKRPDEDALRSRIIELVCNYGRHGLTTCRRLDCEP